MSTLKPFSCAWLKYHTITKFARSCAHRMYQERKNNLLKLIRVVITFDEETEQESAYIRYRNFTVCRLGSLDGVSDQLSEIRKLNKHIEI